MVPPLFTNRSPYQPHQVRHINYGSYSNTITGVTVQAYLSSAVYSKMYSTIRQNSFPPTKNSLYSLYSLLFLFTVFYCSLVYIYNFVKCFVSKLISSLSNTLLILELITTFLCDFFANFS